MGDIPEGMKPYGPEHPDYPNAPGDWDGGETYRAGIDATYATARNSPYWRAGSGPQATTAYTPIPEQPAPVAGVEQVLDVIDELYRKYGTEMDEADTAIVQAARTAALQRPPAAPSEVEAMREAVRAEIINTPETADFTAGVPLEAAHQRERWSVDHDAGKTAFDWFWLIGFLAQKAASSQVAGDTEKAKHHTISTAAALANWHAQLSGLTAMRPGIGPDNGGNKPGSAHAMASALGEAA